MHPGYSWKCWIGVWTQVEQWHVCSVPGSHTSRVWLTALTLSLQSVVCPLLTLGAGAGLLRAVLWLLLGVSTASLVPAAVLCTCTLMGACTVPHFSCSGSVSRQIFLCTCFQPLTEWEVPTSASCKHFRPYTILPAPQKTSHCPFVSCLWQLIYLS